MSTDPSFPSYPEDSARNEGRPPEKLVQPPSMMTAVLLMRIGAGIALVSVLYPLLTLSSFKDDVRSSLVDSDSTLTASQLDTAINALIVVTVIAGIIGASLWLWMAWANGRGRKWARIVASVFGGLNIVSALYALTSSQSTTVSMLLALVQLVVGAGALFYLYRPDSSAFYNASARPGY